MRERLLLVAGGLLLISSSFLPWRHPRSHWRELWTHLEPLPGCIADREWDAAAYFSVVSFGLASPAWLGITLLVAAGPAGRGRRVATSALALLLLLGLTASAWIYGILSFEGKDLVVVRPWKYAGLVVGAGLTVIALLEMGRAWACMRRGVPGSERRLLLLPLALFLISGLVAANVLRKYAEWHVIDYWAIAAGALAGIFGAARRPQSHPAP